MATVDDLFPLVLPSAPTATYDLVRGSILRAVIELCEKGLVWQKTLTPKAVVNQVNEYALDVPDGTRVAQIMSVVCGGRPLSPKTITELPALPSWMDSIGFPESFTQLDLSSVRLIPTPFNTSNIEIVARCALAPKRSSLEFSDEVYERFLDVIANGALGYLLSQPRQAWTNISEASIFKQLFDSAVALARVGAEKNFTRASSTIRPRRYL